MHSACPSCGQGAFDHVVRVHATAGGLMFGTNSMLIEGIMVLSQSQGLVALCMTRVNPHA